MEDYLVVEVEEQVMLDIQKCHLLFQPLLQVVVWVVMVILFHGVLNLLVMLVHLAAVVVVPMVRVILWVVEVVLQELVLVD
jgi:hypothetical protein